MLCDIDWWYHISFLPLLSQGMQRNPGARTIESELESALAAAGAISEQNAGSFQKVGVRCDRHVW